jgi:hypothetical protein
LKALENDKNEGPNMINTRLKSLSPQRQDDTVSPHNSINNSNSVNQLTLKTLNKDERLGGKINLYGLK